MSKQLPEDIQWIKMLLEFHKAMEVDYYNEPLIPSRSRVRLRQDIFAEEFRELNKAMDESNLIEIADAIIDCIYVLIGTAWEYGLANKLNELFAEVHRSNMSKLDNGKCIKREDGKVLKSSNYTPPNLKTIIYERTTT